MRAQRFGRWLLVASVMLIAAACQPAQSLSAPPAPRSMIVPIAMFEVTAVPTSVPVPTPVRQTLSGMRLAANISPVCARATQSSAGCVQPYAGEFVITQLNGAEVTRVMTNLKGQATIDLPPGNYILGVRTEDIYPLGAPVKVDVLPDHYIYISLSLDSGLQWQSQRK